MPRIQTFCHECEESLEGHDGAECRYCHQLFCEGCGNTTARICDSCGDEQAEVMEFVEKDGRERSEEGLLSGEDEEDSGYGEARDIDYFGGK